jgi:drug/metabolite transporter (DMT)-like permease
MAAMPPAVGAAALVGITLIWGTTFVVIKEVLNTIPVPLLLALRFTLAGLLLSWARFDRRAVKPALVLGLLAFIGFATQTMGLSLTTASRAAFITGLSVILTPLVAAAWLRRRVAGRAYLAALVALAGLGMMTLHGGAKAINGGDVWVLATALAYALFIVYLGEVAGRASATSLAALQHVPMALLAWLWALPQVGELRHVPLTTYLAILYLAAVATALVAVVQTYAQRVVPAQVAALIFVLEPVVASIFAFFLLGERLGLVGWIGGALVVAAMFLSELRPRRRPVPSGHPLASARSASTPGGPDAGRGDAGSGRADG